jgi:hypothetical protein
VVSLVTFVLTTFMSQLSDFVESICDTKFLKTTNARIIDLNQSRFRTTTVSTTFIVLEFTTSSSVDLHDIVFVFFNFINAFAFIFSFIEFQVSNAEIECT